MTGGGPGNATRHYGILVDEKSIGSLQHGPGAALALSVAPLMAVLTWPLARFMRPDDHRAGTDRTPAIAPLPARSQRSPSAMRRQAARACARVRSANRRGGWQ